ncbi:hypothetical protein ABIA30_001478 [Mycobacterium sp. MAA66]|uniref:hypothetical protein n=1 Tax=Mycobacterium sp. MAA66 TaxID=3156297 RepID=UPI003514DC9F
MEELYCGAVFDGGGATDSVGAGGATALETTGGAVAVSVAAGDCVRVGSALAVMKSEWIMPRPAELPDRITTAITNAANRVSSTAHDTAKAFTERLRVDPTGERRRPRTRLPLAEPVLTMVSIGKVAAGFILGCPLSTGMPG